MHGTPDTSFVTARRAHSPGQSQGSSQSAWGRGARARLPAPVQSASPFIDHLARWGHCLSACCPPPQPPSPGSSCWSQCSELDSSLSTMSSQEGCCHASQTHSSGCTASQAMRKLVHTLHNLTGLGLPMHVTFSLPTLGCSPLPWPAMLIQLSENIMACRQEKGSALDSMASPLAAGQPSQCPGPFTQTGQPHSSTLLTPASAHSRPAGASEHSENRGSSPAASRYSQRSQDKFPPRQSSVEGRPASQWPPSGRSSPAEGLGQPERSLWRSVLEHQATGSGLYRDKPQGAWGGAPLPEDCSVHAPLPKLEVPESSSWLALHQVVVLLLLAHAFAPGLPLPLPSLKHAMSHCLSGRWLQCPRYSLDTVGTVSLAGFRYSCAASPPCTLWPATRANICAI